MDIKRKQYRKMLKVYKKKLIKIAKQAADEPFDYDAMIDFLVANLKLMQEYYKNDYNVAQDTNNEDNKKAIQSISTALDLYDKYTNVMREFVNYDDDSSIVIDPDTKRMNVTGVSYKYPDDIDRNYKEANEKGEQYWNEFWTCVKENIRTWWD